MPGHLPSARHAMTAPGGGDILVWAQARYQEHLGPRSTRHRHVAACAEKVGSALAVVPGDEDLALALVYLHDLGFCEQARGTGFSTLDCARFVRGLGAPDRVVDLLAHQFLGPVEAGFRGLQGYYRDFGPDERGPVRDLLWSVCLTTDSDGKDITVAQRCDAWWHRYADTSDWLGDYLHAAQAELQAADERTRQRAEQAR